MKANKLSPFTSSNVRKNPITKAERLKTQEPGIRPKMRKFIPEDEGLREQKQGRLFQKLKGAGMPLFRRIQFWKYRHGFDMA